MKRDRYPVKYCDYCSTKLYLVKTPRGGWWRYDATTLLPHQCKVRKPRGGDAMHRAVTGFVPKCSRYEAHV